MARKGRNKKDEASGGGIGGKGRAAIFLVIALIAGMSATVVIYNLIQNYQQRIAEARRPADTVKVVIASRDLYQGITITEDDLVQIDIEPTFLPGGDEKLVYTSAEHIIGRIPRERILANEFIREERLADPETGTGLNAIIPRSMRALSVNISDGQALSGFLNPGDYVDIVVTIQSDDRDDRTLGPQTNTISQAVYVLAVNDRTNKAKKNEDEDPRNKKKSKTKALRPSVTVAVTPDQAEQIAFAERRGEITLTLRNVQDLQFIESVGSSTNDVLGIKPEEPKPVVKAKPRPKPKEPEVKAPEGQTLTIVRGDDVTTRTYYEEGEGTNEGEKPK